MVDVSYRIVRSAADLNEAQYEAFLDQSATATIYHTRGWLLALEDGLGMDAAHVLVEKGENPIGMLPGFLADVEDTPLKRLVSVNPGRGGPALTGDWETVLDELFAGIQDICSGTTVSHTIRTDVPKHLALNDYLCDRGYSIRVGGKFVLSLDQDWDTIMDEMHKDRRYNLRKGHETDYEIRELDPASALDEFYRDYMSKLSELEKSPYPKRFFNSLVESIGDKIVLLTNHVDGERHGFHLYLVDEYQRRIRHYLMTIAREDYDYYSGELLHEHMIRRGIEGNWKEYDFGGHDVDFRDGGFKYKQQFGGVLEPEFRWRKEHSTAFAVARRVANYIR